MFLRIKHIKGNDYAYAVGSRWTPKGPRQVSKKYLGRVLSLSRSDAPPFSDAAFAETHTPKETLKAVYASELSAYGFTQKSKRLYEKDGLVASVDGFSIKKEGKEIVLVNGEGYLCSYLLQKVARYLPKRESLQEDTERFAKLVTAAGLHLSEEASVAWFSRIYNG